MNNVRKMTRQQRTWNATLRSTSLFCGQTEAIEGCCREEKYDQDCFFPHSIYLISFLNGSCKPLRGIDGFLFVLLYFSTISLVVLFSYISVEMAVYLFSHLKKHYGPSKKYVWNKGWQMFSFYLKKIK